MRGDRWSTDEHVSERDGRAARDLFGIVEDMTTPSARSRLELFGPRRNHPDRVRREAGPWHQVDPVHDVPVQGAHRVSGHYIDPTAALGFSLPLTSPKRNCRSITSHRRCVRRRCFLLRARHQRRGVRPLVCCCRRSPATLSWLGRATAGGVAFLIRRVVVEHLVDISGGGGPPVPHRCTPSGGRALFARHRWSTLGCHCRRDLFRRGCDALLSCCGHRGERQRSSSGISILRTLRKDFSRSGWALLSQTGVTRRSF